MRLGGYFTEDHDHPGFGSGLTSDLGERVLLQAGIKLRKIRQRDWYSDGTGDTHNSVRDLIANLVWMTLADRLGGEEEVARGEGWAGGSVSVGGHFGGSGE